MRKCPICKGPAKGGTERSFFPFCSERCQRVDLGNWLDEGYRLAEPAAELAAEEGRGAREQSE